MNRFLITIGLCIAFLLSFTNMGFTQNRDVSSSDLRGVPTSHKYFWSVLGGTAVGAGIGWIAPGGTKSVFKGLMLGGSATSALYLAKNRRAGGDARPFAHILTNATLGSSLLWTICNCNTGGYAGGLIGGGATALFQALGTHSSSVRSFTSSNSPPEGVPAATPNSQSKTAFYTVPDDKISGNEGAPPEQLVTPPPQEE